MEPLSLTLQSHLVESKKELGLELTGQFGLVRSRGFIPTIVYTDPQSSFRAMANDFPGVVIDMGGDDDYVAKSDVRIAYIKRTHRTIKHGLPWS